MSDDATGFLVIPKRYNTGGREKIDLIRDSMSDREFVQYCLGNVMKYKDRNKPNPDPSKPSDDPEKFRFYTEMARSLQHGTPDPRHRRPDFTPYKRASMPEPLPERRIKVLDRGFVRLVEDWGHGDARLPEAGIIEAARQSTKGSFRGWRRDRKLLEYLYCNKHSTPFEFAGMVLEVRAPLFVFREWMRHRTQGYNETSGRYVPIPNINYLPTWQEVYRRGQLASANKQAGSADGSKPITTSAASRFVENLKKQYEDYDEEYHGALAEGVPKELARIGMPLGRYSQMRATSVLRNWLGFLTLRMDPSAQWEIRQYANAVHEIVSEQFPETARLFDGK